MCVLTFVPSGYGFILTNNRDENLAREKAIFPQKYHLENTSIYYPKDPVGGGTWIATNTQYTLCLLNGAFVKHKPVGKYMHSRGRVILDFFENGDLELLKNDFHFVGFENFTLIIIDSKSENISQLVWDGNKVHFQELDFKSPYIWSSCTLYSDEIREQRALLFSEFLAKNPSVMESQLFDFHRFTELDGEHNHFVMQRADGTQTQSISQISKQKNELRFSYSDLITAEEKSLIIV